MILHLQPTRFIQKAIFGFGRAPETLWKHKKQKTCMHNYSPADYQPFVWRSHSAETIRTLPGTDACEKDPAACCGPDFN